MEDTRDRRYSRFLYNIRGHIAGYVFYILLFLAAGVGIGMLLHGRAVKKWLREKDFYCVSEVMEQAGYEQRGTDTYHKTEQGMEILITFDFANAVCTKNMYQFNLWEAYETYGSEIYMSGAVLKDIVNCELTYTKGNHFQVEPVGLQSVDWTELSPLIAHAGGAVREKDYSATYTNSLEALVQNYNLGHRVFEYDFCLTSDGRLACIHDWKTYGELDGEVASQEQWLASEMSGRYTTMMLDDLMNQMLVNRDFFVITDTKSYDLTDEEIAYQFQLLYDTAMEKDPELLDRFIPQIYFDEMYDIIMEIYPWNSVIYTAYATEETGDQIVGFAEEHDNINVITCPTDDKRFDDITKDWIHMLGKKLYTHTVNTYSKMTDYAGSGVDGFYTDFLLPSDAEVYEQYKDTSVPSQSFFNL